MKWLLLVVVLAGCGFQEAFEDQVHMIGRGRIDCRTTYHILKDNQNTKYLYVSGSVQASMVVMPEKEAPKGE
jgi:hypothetical protein